MLGYTDKNVAVRSLRSRQPRRLGSKSFKTGHFGRQKLNPVSNLTVPLISKLSSKSQQKKFVSFKNVFLVSEKIYLNRISLYLFICLFPSKQEFLLPRW